MSEYGYDGDGSGEMIVVMMGYDGDRSWARWWYDDNDRNDSDGAGGNGDGDVDDSNGYGR